MKEKVSNFLCQEGYFSTTTSLPEFMVHFLPVNGNAEVVVTIDYRKEIYLTDDVYTSIKENFARSFKEKGFANTHILTLVLCSEPEKMDAVFGNDSFSWYIDVNEKKLLIPKDHVEDFYGIKKKTEEFIQNTDNYIEEFEAGHKDINKKIIKRSFRQLPFINVAIIVINILVFILSAFMPEMLYNRGAFSFLLIQETKEYYRFLSAAFFHVGTDHLFSNMVMLFFLGNTLELRIGHLKYAILYILSALGGNLLSSIYEVNYGNVFLSVGASGAIFGVIAAVFILVIMQGGRWESISLSRMLLMIAYLLYSGFVSENVNNVGNIGGFAAGLLIMIFYSIMSRQQKKKEVPHEN